MGEIGRGFLVLLGVSQEDSDSDVHYIVRKIAGLRVFEDHTGKMNLSIEKVNGEILVVSQFTLYGDCRKGRRPSFVSAADPEKAEQLYMKVVSELELLGIKVATGRFQQQMDVQLTNDGPVTILLDSRKTF